MQVAIDRRPGSVVGITVTVEPAILLERMDKLFAKHARHVSVPGFRPGKAPRSMLAGRIDQEALFQEAVDSVIDSSYRDALRESNLQPLERGEVEDVKVGEDNSLTYTVRVPVRPEIVLPEYTGLEVTYTVTQVTDEQVDAEIERLLQMTTDFSEVMDEGIRAGDYVTIDYTMKVNGEDYPAGDVTGYPLEVGNDTFFPELNEGLLDARQGDTVTITTTYPEDSTNETLAGKTAEYAVVIQQVRRLSVPEPSDAWAQMVTQGALTTLDELRDRIRHNLQLVAQQADRDHVRDELVLQIVRQADFDIPATLEEEQFEHQMHDLEHRLSHERMTLRDYAEDRNRTVDSIREEQRILARDFIRRSFVLQEIARRENLMVTDEEIDAVISLEAETPRDVKRMRKEMEKSGRLDNLASRIFHEKVLGFLESHAMITAEGMPEIEQETPTAEASQEAAETGEETGESSQ